VTAFFAVVMGFALIWHIWWMAFVGLACAIVTLLVFGWVERVDHRVSGAALERESRRPRADPT